MFQVTDRDEYEATGEDNINRTVLAACFYCFLT
jgi:hypothetical protein